MVEKFCNVMRWEGGWVAGKVGGCTDPSLPLGSFTTSLTQTRSVENYKTVISGSTNLIDLYDPRDLHMLMRVLRNIPSGI